MFDEEGLLAHIHGLSLGDWLTLLYILLLLIQVIISNYLFKGFLASKPEGRKTVLGMCSYKVLYFKMHTFYLLLFKSLDLKKYISWNITMTGNMLFYVGFKAFKS